MTPTKQQIARRLRTLANRMEDVGVDMEYYGGFAELALGGQELVGWACIARGWAYSILEKTDPAKKAGKKGTPK